MMRIFCCDLFVLGHNRTALAVSAQVFAGIKAEAAGSADRPGFFVLVSGAVGLAGIFDDDEVISLCDFHDGIHVGRLAVEMDGNNRLYRRLSWLIGCI